MNIAIFCEESQEVVKAMRANGHNAFSFDLQECSGGHPEWHVMGDCLPYLNGRCGFKTMDGKEHEIPGKWDLIIAHPPCTYLSNAGARWLYAGGKLNADRYQKGLDGKAFFMKFYDADCERIAIENPVPSTVYELPKYSQTIEPYQFGHTATKKTCLWLKGLPLLMETNNVGRPEKIYFQKKDGSWRTTCWEMNQRGDRAKSRSKTFPGIAKAMADQWAPDEVWEDWM